MDMPNVPQQSTDKAAPRPLAVLISESHLLSDGRANFFGHVLSDCGFTVIGAGYGEGIYTPPTAQSRFAKIVSIPTPLASRGRRYLMRLAMFAGSLFGNPMRQPHWLLRLQFPLIDAIEVALDKEESAPALIVAKYWTATPAAAYLARKYGAKWHYDANELSFAERDYSTLWKLAYRPLTMRVEKAALNAADQATTVGDAYAVAIANQYGLARAPQVVRNLPASPPIPPRQPKETIRFIYSGHCHPSRRIDTIVRSVTDWKPNRHLVLQLVGNQRDQTDLRDLVDDLGLADKVTFRSPVARDQLIDDLSEHNVGLALFPIDTAQYRLCEPNKLYQYIYAGLPLIVARGSDMAQTVEKYKCGWSCASGEASAVAALVNSIAFDDVAAMQHGVIHMQSDFTYGNEAARLAEIATQSLVNHKDKKA